MPDNGGQQQRRQNNGNANNNKGGGQQRRQQQGQRNNDANDDDDEGGGGVAVGSVTAGGAASAATSRRRQQRPRAEIREDDILHPVAGILDVLDNYAFVRTRGYLPGANDVYVSLARSKKHNLRKGDAVVGAIRQAREGDEHQGRAEVQRDGAHRLGQRPDPSTRRRTASSSAS